MNWSYRQPGGGDFKARVPSGPRGWVKLLYIPNIQDRPGCYTWVSRDDWDRLTQETESVTHSVVEALLGYATPIRDLMEGGWICRPSGVTRLPRGDMEAFITEYRRAEDEFEVRLAKTLYCPFHRG